jgi:hypothetical protein
VGGLLGLTAGLLFNGLVERMVGPVGHV